jgi:hypothetical protein
VEGFPVAHLALVAHLVSQVVADHLEADLVCSKVSGFQMKHANTMQPVSLLLVALQVSQDPQALVDLLGSLAAVDLLLALVDDKSGKVVWRELATSKAYQERQSVLHQQSQLCQPGTRLCEKMATSFET